LVTAYDPFHSRPPLTPYTTLFRSGARPLRIGDLLGQREVDQAVIAGAAGEAVGAGVPRPLPLGDEDLDRVPLEGEVLLVRDAVLERGEALEALLHDLLRQLVLHGRRRGPRADRVLEGESAREPGGLDDLER